MVLSGGVALNCSANGRLRHSSLVDDLFVFGAAHDAGTALGAALQVAAELGEPLAGARMRDAYLGADHATGVAVDHAQRLGLAVHQRSDVEVLAGDLIHAGAIGGWYRGRSEFGPRALGDRSIIARADSSEVRDRVNKAKGRELWRPLAPALSARAARRMGLEGDLYFMIEAHWLSANHADEWASQLAGVLHVDQSMRPLVVTDPTHPFHALLEALEAQHGLAAVMNTSFNNEREPMVETPTDALRTFASSDLDFLVLEQALIEKPQQVRDIALGDLPLSGAVWVHRAGSVF